MSTPRTDTEILNWLEETPLRWTPDPIGEQLAALQRAMDAEIEAVKAKYRTPMTDLRAAFARARVQRSAA